MDPISNGFKSRCLRRRRRRRRCRCCRCRLQSTPLSPRRTPSPPLVLHRRRLHSISGHHHLCHLVTWSLPPGRPRARQHALQARNLGFMASQLSTSHIRAGQNSYKIMYKWVLPQNFLRLRRAIGHLISDPSRKYLWYAPHWARVSQHNRSLCRQCRQCRQCRHSHRSSGAAGARSGSSNCSGT